MYKRQENGQRPYQTITQIFHIRNNLAHGKAELLTQKPITESGTQEELRRKSLRTKWEEACTLIFAKKAFEDTEHIAENLWKKAGLVEHELRARGQSYSISTCRDNNAAGCVE